MVSSCPCPAESAVELPAAADQHNRRAFVSGYLGTPGIGGLVGPDRDLVRRLVSFLELARSVRGS